MKKYAATYVANWIVISVSMNVQMDGKDWKPF